MKFKGVVRNLPSFVLAGLLAVAILQPLAAGASNPADKAAASGDHLVVVPAAPVGVDNPKGTPLLQTDIKTSAPEDLIFEVTMECSILSTVYTEGGAKSTSTSSAQGTLRAWLTINNIDPNDPAKEFIVPIQSSSDNPQPSNPSGPGNDSDKVTFCHHDRGQTVTDAENDGDGVDTLQTYLETKTADAFNWVFFNAGAGVHHITLYGDLTTSPPPPSNQTCNSQSQFSCATGYVGNRTLIIEPDKFPNNAAVTNPSPAP